MWNGSRPRTRLALASLVLLLAVAAAQPASAGNPRPRGWYGTVDYHYWGLGMDTFGAIGGLGIDVNLTLRSGFARVSGSYRFVGWGRIAGDCPNTLYENRGHGVFPKRVPIPPLAQLTPGTYSLGETNVPMSLFYAYQVVVGDCGRETDHQVTDIGIAIPRAESNGDISKDDQLQGSLARDWPDCPSPGGVDTGNAEIHCHDSVDWSLTRGPLKSPEEIDEARRNARDFETFAKTTALIAAVCRTAPLPWTQLCAKIAAVVAASAGLLDMHFKRWADDPPDPHFTNVARPRRPALPRLSAPAGTAGSAVRAVNSLVANEASAIGLTRAVVTAMERAQGAERVHNRRWRRRQLRAAHRYAGRLARVLRKDPAKRGAARTALERAGFPTVSLQPDAVGPLQMAIVKEGLPQDLANDLKAGDISGPALQSFQMSIATTGVDELLRPPAFPASLSTPTLTRSARGLARLFTAFSRGR